MGFHADKSSLAVSGCCKPTCELYQIHSTSLPLVRFWVCPLPFADVIYVWPPIIMVTYYVLSILNPSWFRGVIIDSCKKYASFLLPNSVILSAVKSCGPN